MQSLIVLVHGFFKDRHDMAYLVQGLRSTDDDVIAVDLPTTLGSLHDCIEALHDQIGGVILRYRQVGFVAHSMGGLIVRGYVERYRPLNVTQCVCIATPHLGSALADVASAIPGVSRVLKPMAALRARQDKRPLRRFISGPIGLIVGTRNNLRTGRLFLREPSDGRVAVASAKAAEANDVIELPFNHHEIHHRLETLLLVRKFLACGHF